jgi:predicted ABC-type ATPase
MPKTPVLYVIAGCNGAGKTTFAKEFLPNEVKCLRFLNADEIARGLSPLKPEAAGVKAGRLLLNEIRDCLAKRQTFAIESTLSGKTYVRMFQQARELGYVIELHYLWLSKVGTAIRRVQERVKKGGHHVPAADIRRRFKRSLHHLVQDYLPLADRWAFYSNEAHPAKLLADSQRNAIEDLSLYFKP